MSTAKREVGPLILKLRKILARREDIKSGLRFADELVARTQPPPNLPPGPHSQLSANYYYTRDARREVCPPLLIAENTGLLKLAGGEQKQLSAVKRIPGKVYSWD